MPQRWIKLIQASQYSSIGQKRLKELGKKGIIRGFPDPDSKRKDWIFDRESLDNYRLNQAPESIEEKMLAFRSKNNL